MSEVDLVIKKELLVGQLKMLAEICMIETARMMREDPPNDATLKDLAHTFAESFLEEWLSQNVGFNQ